jgi:hypothetical protein
VPPAPIYDSCNHWIIETFKRLGTETQMGAKLYAAFVAAGLPAPAMQASSIIGGGDSASKASVITFPVGRRCQAHLGDMPTAQDDPLRPWNKAVRGTFKRM